MDIRDYPDVVDTINAIVNNKGTAEIKTETKKVDGEIVQNLVVVEICRSVKIKERNA